MIVSKNPPKIGRLIVKLTAVFLLGFAVILGLIAYKLVRYHDELKARQEPTIDVLNGRLSAIQLDIVNLHLSIRDLKAKGEEKKKIEIAQKIEQDARKAQLRESQLAVESAENTTAMKRQEHKNLEFQIGANKQKQQYYKELAERERQRRTLNDLSAFHLTTTTGASPAKSIACDNTLKEHTRTPVRIDLGQPGQGELKFSNQIENDLRVRKIGSVESNELIGWDKLNMFFYVDRDFKLNGVSTLEATANAIQFQLPVELRDPRNQLLVTWSYVVFYAAQYSELWIFEPGTLKLQSRLHLDGIFRNYRFNNSDIILIVREKTGKTLPRNPTDRDAENLELGLLNLTTGFHSKVESRTKTPIAGLHRLVVATHSKLFLPEDNSSLRSFALHDAKLTPGEVYRSSSKVDREDPIPLNEGRHLIWPDKDHKSTSVSFITFQKEIPMDMLIQTRSIAVSPYPQYFYARTPLHDLARFEGPDPRITGAIKLRVAQSYKIPQFDDTEVRYFSCAILPKNMQVDRHVLATNAGNLFLIEHSIPRKKK